MSQEAGHCWRGELPGGRPPKTLFNLRTPWSGVLSATYKYVVTFKPKAGWVDNIYLGNMLGELLSNMANQSDAFEFEVQYQEESQGEAKEKHTG